MDEVQPRKPNIAVNWSEFAPSRIPIGTRPRLPRFPIAKPIEFNSSARGLTLALFVPKPQIAE
jgi:hypothetical protein